MSSVSPRHRRPTNLPVFLFGAPYYPEHWTATEREDDPLRMAAAGVNTVRMAEFAWDRIEPSPGQYDFGFFDEQVARLGAMGIRTILCTPTATPPRWLTARHPDVLRIDRDGRVQPHGSRQHACTTSQTFRNYSRAITTAMADHYAANPHVIGWQTDNELNCHFALCYCPSCAAAFIEWCRRKYADDIAALNQAWGCAFWALTFQTFEQVTLPYGRPARANPAQVLDYRRFVSESVCDFQREQAQILRRANGRWFITHNGLMQEIDYAVMARDLDMLGVDVYPGFADAPETAALWTDRARAMAGNVLVPELQSGPGGQCDAILKTPPPGQMRLWAYQCIAHGADGILHFRWRTARFGAESYWCGVLDHDNQPRRRYEEFAREGTELRHIGHELLGTSVDIAAGVLLSHDQDLAHASCSLGLPSPRQQAETAYRALWDRKMPVGFVEAGDSFEGLKLLVLPTFPMMDEALTRRLSDYVAAGGTLLVTAWTGTRDFANRISPLTPPGLLADLAGVTVEEYGRLDEGDNELDFCGGRTTPAWAWYEMLNASAARTLATWSRGHYADTAAMTHHETGAGSTLYVGTFLGSANASVIVELAATVARLDPVLPALPPAVEATRRTAAGKELLFLLNHSDHFQDIPGVPPGVDLLTGAAVGGKVSLPPREVAIIKVRR